MCRGKPSKRHQGLLHRSGGRGRERERETERGTEVMREGKGKCEVPLLEMIIWWIECVSVYLFACTNTNVHFHLFPTWLISCTLLPLLYSEVVFLGRKLFCIFGDMRQAFGECFSKQWLIDCCCYETYRHLQECPTDLTTPYCITYIYWYKHW